MQQKMKGERKPVASEKVIKEVRERERERNYYFLTIIMQLLGELYSDREYLDKLMKDPGLSPTQHLYMYIHSCIT